MALNMSFLRELATTSQRNSMLLSSLVTLNVKSERVSPGWSERARDWFTRTHCGAPTLSGSASARFDHTTCGAGVPPLVTHESVTVAPAWYTLCSCPLITGGDGSTAAHTLYCSLSH